ncbi:MAG TPA: dihydropteroate synthase [Candidatus Angelobacter sp.]|jgi:dihydropteroate synthase|nr:dihydropteroate synthase [Candidatus Angelobacter sp.]
MQRPSYIWELCRRKLELGRATLVMGILNVTPDSFSDGGQFLSHDHAVRHAVQMLDEGANIIDIGGESTRPGTNTGETGLPAGEELGRVLPVIEDVLRERPNAVVSVDTYKHEVADACISAGAEIVNDVSALRWDPQMISTVAELKCGIILMHSRGRPQEWRTLAPSPDIVSEVKSDLSQWSKRALENGIEHARIVLDPGFGFGKSFEQNYPLLSGLDKLHELGFPLFSGTSRKSFIGRTLAQNGQDAPVSQRLYGTLATIVASVLKGAHIVRVHDVRPAVEVVKVADQIAQIG